MTKSTPTRDEAVRELAALSHEWPIPDPVRAFIDRLLASAPAPASRVDAGKVKALEWHKVGPREWRAVTVFGDAVIHEGAHGDFVWRIAPHTLRGASGSEKSLETATAVLWANYEARIRSALSPAATPAPKRSSDGGQRIVDGLTDVIDYLDGDESAATLVTASAATPVEAGGCRCAICGGEHDNDALADICRRCEETAPWREEPADGGDA